MSVRKSLLAFLVSVVLVSLAGCGGGSGPNLPPVDDRLFVPNYVSTLDGLYHWNHLPVRIAFFLPSNWQQLYPGNDTLHVRAAEEWNQPGLQALVQVVSTAQIRDVNVYFVPQSELHGDTTQGLTEYTYDSYHVMHSATIKVALDLPGGGTVAPADVQATIAHEIGHAIGIGGHSLNPDDLMYSTLTYGDPQFVTQRDLNTAMSAYPSYFGRTVPSAPEPIRAPSELFTGVIE